MTHKADLVYDVEIMRECVAHIKKHSKHFTANIDIATLSGIANSSFNKILNGQYKFKHRYFILFKDMINGPSMDGVVTQDMRDMFKNAEPINDPDDFFAEEDQANDQRHAELAEKLLVAIAGNAYYSQHDFDQCIKAANDMARLFIESQEEAKTNV